MPLSRDNEACLAWLAEALRRPRPEGQERIVGYLGAVLEEVLFETKVIPEGCPRAVTYRAEGA
jgi:hypothetical protein